MEPGTRRNAKAASASRGVCPQQRWVAALTGRARRLRFPSFFWDYSLNAVTPKRGLRSALGAEVPTLPPLARSRGWRRRGGRESGTRSCSSGTSLYLPPHPRSESCLAPAEERAGCELSTPQIRPPRNKARSPVHRFQLTHGRAQPLPAAGRRAGGFWPGGSHAALWTGDSQSAQRVPPTQCKGGFL